MLADVLKALFPGLDAQPSTSSTLFGLLTCASLGYLWFPRA